MRFFYPEVLTLFYDKFPKAFRQKNILFNNYLKKYIDDILHVLREVNKCKSKCALILNYFLLNHKI